MNSLLQALSGCFKFTDYLDRVLKSISLDCDDPNHIKIFLFIKTIKELQRGQPFSADLAVTLHEHLCETDLDQNNFTNFFEQQDCHDLMFYFLEKVTELTAKFARQQISNEGLRIGL